VNTLRSRDRDALASFYDTHAGRVREYCALICPSSLVDEATFVSFVDFLGRLDGSGADAGADLEETLWKATRGSAAGRAEIKDAPGAGVRGRRSAPAEPGEICRAMPELLAAYASGELTRNAQLDRHLVECSICRNTATRFREAEGAFGREGREQPPAEIRRVWLEIATNDRASVEY
jgi:hypothetical protein